MWFCPDWGTSLTEDIFIREGKEYGFHWQGVGEGGGVQGQTAVQSSVCFAAIYHWLTCQAHPPFMCFEGCISICRSAKVTDSLMFDLVLILAVSRFWLFCTVILAIYGIDIKVRRLYVWIGMALSCK